MSTTDNKQEVPATLPQLIEALLTLKNDKAMIAWLRDETGERSFGKPCLAPECDPAYEKFPQQCDLVEFVRNATWDVPLIDYVEVESVATKKMVLQLDLETMRELTDNGIEVLVAVSKNVMGEDPAVVITYDLGDLIV